jgi:hypothetical protein
MLSWRSWGRAERERPPAGLGAAGGASSDRETRSWPLRARFPSFPLITPRLRTALFSRSTSSPSSDGVQQPHTARGEARSAIHHMLASSGWSGRDDDTSSPGRRYPQKSEGSAWSPAAAGSLDALSREALHGTAAVRGGTTATHARSAHADEASPSTRSHHTEQHGSRPLSSIRASTAETSRDATAKQLHARFYSPGGSGEESGVHNNTLPRPGASALSEALYAAYDASEREPEKTENTRVHQATPPRAATGESAAKAPLGSVEAASPPQAGAENEDGGNEGGSGGKDHITGQRRRERMGYLKLKHPNVLLREEKLAREESQASARKRVQESNSLSDIDKLLYWAQQKDETNRTQQEQAAAAEHEKKQRAKDRREEEERQRKVLDEEQKRARRTSRVQEMLRASQAQAEEHAEKVSQKRDETFRETLRHHRERANRRQPLDPNGGGGGGGAAAAAAADKDSGDSAPRPGAGSEERERGKEEAKGMGTGRERGGQDRGQPGQGLGKGRDEDTSGSRQGKASSSTSSASSGRTKAAPEKEAGVGAAGGGRQGREDYESKYERFETQAKAGVCIRYDDVPFPNMAMLKDMARKLDVPMQRKVIKTWSRRWHPDTWARYRLEDAERGRIMDRVLEESKEINALLRFYKE